MATDDSLKSVLPGAQLGPYSIEARLGAGGMGDVFRAHDTRWGRTVAIKVIRPEFSQRADSHHRFQREARAISALNHPHVCSLHDVGEWDGLAYLVVESVEGATLADILEKGLLPWVLRHASLPWRQHAGAGCQHSARNPQAAWNTSF